MDRQPRAGDSVSFFLIFFALIFGAVLYPCVWVGEKAGCEQNWRKAKYYPGCANTSSSYMCEREGYKWDGTYKEDRGIALPEY